MLNYYAGVERRRREAPLHSMAKAQVKLALETSCSSSDSENRVQSDPAFGHGPLLSSALLSSVEHTLSSEVLQTLWAVNMRASAKLTSGDGDRAKDMHALDLARDAYDAVWTCASALREILEKKRAPTTSALVAARLA